MLANSFSYSQLGWGSGTPGTLIFVALRDWKMSLERKGGRPSSTAGRKAFPHKDGALRTATEGSRKAWSKTSAQFGLLGLAPFPWLKLVYLDESRAHPLSLLCQKEGRKTRENTRESSGSDASSDLPSRGPPVLLISCHKWLLAVERSKKGRT